MFIVRPQESERIVVGGLVLTIRMPSSASNGRYALIEWEVKAAARTPMITFKKGESTIYVTEGRFELQYANRTCVLEPGAAVLVPRKTTFALKNARNEPGTFLSLVSPGGFDEYARELSQLVRHRDPGIAEQLHELNARYGIELTMA